MMPTRHPSGSSQIVRIDLPATFTLPPQAMERSIRRSAPVRLLRRWRFCLCATGSRADPHQQLTEILALQQAEEALRRILEPVDEILAIFELAAADPGGDVVQEILLAVGKVPDDEAADEKAFPQHREHVGAGKGRCHIVLRDEPADRDAGEGVEQRPYCLLHRTADILEIDIDALGAGRLELPREIGRIVVETFIEAELVLDEAAFLGAAGDADRAAALDLGDLPHDGADRARGGSDDDRLARLRLADL